MPTTERLWPLPKPRAVTQHSADVNGRRRCQATVITVIPSRSVRSTYSVAFRPLMRGSPMLLKPWKQNPSMVISLPLCLSGSVNNWSNVNSRCESHPVT